MSSYSKYPHTIIASVVLKNNKIKYWKVGQHPLSLKYNIPETVKMHPEYSYEEKEWTVNNDEENEKIFNVDSIDWLKQWELHETFTGDSPFEEEPFSNEFIKIIKKKG